MPELPEVETTLRGIKPHILGQKVQKIIVRHPRLRWPIPLNLEQTLTGQTLRRLQRRGKYLLLQFETQALILHLGMSGSLCIFRAKEPPKKHDHLDIVFGNGHCLRLNDPRRFGAVLLSGNPKTHPLLRDLGPEPLTKKFTSAYLWQRAQGKKTPIKSFIMDCKIVVGVGNIYATEALFMARIFPKKPASAVTRAQYQRLVSAIQTVLGKAIKHGGTTLRNFLHSEGKPGYFSLELKVYGKEGKACPRCQAPLECMTIAQRSTVYCPNCQTQ